MNAERRTFFKHDMPSRVESAITEKLKAAADERRINLEIDRRDMRVCRCCGRRSDPDRVGLLERGHRHHIVYRSAGGSDEAFNRVTLCAGCHSDEHSNKLRFTHDGLGYDKVNANEGMEFWRPDVWRGNDSGRWYLVHRELAPHRHERD